MIGEGRVPHEDGARAVGPAPHAVCWFCGASIAAARAEVESVLKTRSAAEGGPFHTLSCPRCRTRCGALRNRLGEWMLYPLEGAAEPSLLDRVVPRTSRAHFARARAWWLRNAGAVERFRARRISDGEAPRKRPRTSPATPPPRRSPPPRGPTPSPGRDGAQRRTRVTSPPPAQPPTAPRDAATPRELLGLPAEITLADVRRAWRAAVKRWHPDRIPTKDPVVLAEAARRFHEYRLAYEDLVAELASSPSE